MYLKWARSGSLTSLFTVLVVLVSACGATASPRTNLVIQYQPVTAGPSISLTVTCVESRATAGTHPNRKAICALLAKKGAKVFASIPPNMACSMIYGGPETARVTGTVRATKIKTTFSRTDGCQVARWSAALALFTFPGNAIITGAIELAPTCPGPQQVGQVCTDPSAAGTVRFTKMSKTITAIAKAGIGYIALLPIGTWSVTASLPRAMSCTETIVKIPTTEPLTVSCDTGIR